MKRFMILVILALLSAAGWSSTISTQFSSRKYNPAQKTRATETTVTQFQAGHGWVRSAGNGTVSDATDEYMYGTQSLKVVTDGSGTTTEVYKLFAPVDMTGKMFRWWFRIDDKSEASLIRIYASSDNFVSTSYYWDTLVSRLSSDVWMPVTFSWASAVKTGTVNRAAINSIKLYIKDASSGALTVWFNEVGAISERNKGIVTFTIDNPRTTSVITNGLPLFEARGFPCTVYVVPADADGADPNACTPAELHILQERGWHIGNHTSSITVHDAWSGYTAAQMEADFKVSKKWFSDNNFIGGGNDFAYPGGNWNETTLPIIRKYCRSARDTGTWPRVYPPWDYCKIPQEDPSVGELSDSLTAVDRAASDKEWCVFVMHGIGVDTGSYSPVSIADLTTLLDYVKTAEAAGTIDVMTVQDVLDSDTERVPIPEISRDPTPRRMTGVTRYKISD